MKYSFRKFSCCTLLMGVFLLCTVSVTKADDSEKEFESNSDPYARGVSLQQEKKYELAAEQFDKAIQKDSSQISAYIEAARAWVLAGKRKIGLKRLESALLTAKKKNDIERIKEQRKTLSEIFYTNTTFQKYQDGLNYMDGMKLRAAIESFEQALAVEPDNVEILIAYARALQTVDDWKESVNILEQAYTINPDKKLTRLLLGKAILNGNHERAIALLKPVVDGKDSSEEASIVYAQALAKGGNTRGAIAVLQKDVDKNTNHIRSVYWLGKYYAEIPENRWVARKHLQTFLRRSEREKDLDDLRSMEKEAKRLIERIHSDLQIDYEHVGQ